MVFARPRCWHLAFLTTVFNVLLWLMLMMNANPSEQDTSPDNRILLSYEYTDPKTGERSESVSTGLSSKLDSSSFTSDIVEPVEPVVSVEPSQASNFINSQKSNNFGLLAATVEKSQIITKTNKENVGEILKFVSSEGVLDKYRLFKKHAFAKTGKEWSYLSQQRNICLGTQTSVDRLYHLVDILTGWTGPLSLAVFVPGIELAIAKRYISFLTKCFPNIDNQVSFHLIEPVDHPGVYQHYSLDEFNSEQQIDCSDYKEFLNQLLTYRTKDMLEWRTSYAYPQNLLRNFAKAGCQTEFTYIPDIDMILSPGMDSRLDRLMSSQEVSSCDKCAYVIPTYEISDNINIFPTDKNQLLPMIKNKTARAFHSKLFNINQKSSLLSEKWEKMEEDAEKEIGYKMENYIFKYEPLYVARANTPQFDERFIGFGMTRNTQVYEMYVAGYEFYILANIFTNHAGFQSLSNRPSWRAKQQENNNAKFDEFAKELSAHYGRDPYKMIEKLPKMNLKNIKVAYTKSKKVKKS